MTFQLDTTGEVPTTDRAFWGGYVKWSDLSPFTQGYIEALLRDLNDKRIDSLGGHHGPAFRFYFPAKFSDLAPETLARIIADCDVARTWAWSLSAPEHLGREFWRLRQEGIYADAFPPLTIQLGDDGKVRFVEETA